MRTLADVVNCKNNLEMGVNRCNFTVKQTSSPLLVFFISYLGLGSLRLAGRGGLTLGVGGGSLAGNVARLASIEGPIDKKCTPFF